MISLKILDNYRKTREREDDREGGKTKGVVTKGRKEFNFTKRSQYRGFPKEFPRMISDDAKINSPRHCTSHSTVLL